MNCSDADAGAGAGDVNNASNINNIETRARREGR